MNFFYDLNKKLNSIGAAPESTQLNEGVADAVKGAIRGFKSPDAANPGIADRVKWAAKGAKANYDTEGNAERGKKAGETLGHAVAGAIKHSYDAVPAIKEGHCPTCNCSPCSCNEGNAFSGAVVKAKRDGIQPGETVTVGGKKYPVKEGAASSSFEILDPKLRDRISSMAGTEVRGNNVSSSDPKVTARLSAFAEKNPERLKQGMDEAQARMRTARKVPGAGPAWVTMIKQYSPLSDAGRRVVEYFNNADSTSLINMNDPAATAEASGLLDEIFYDALENGDDGPALPAEKKDLRFFHNAIKQSEPGMSGRSGTAEPSLPAFLSPETLEMMKQSEARLDKLNLQNYVDQAQQDFNEIDRLAKSEGMGNYKQRKAAKPGTEYYHPDHWTTKDQDKLIAKLEKARARGVVPSKPNFGKNISQSERDREDSRTPYGMMREQGMSEGLPGGSITNNAIKLAIRKLDKYESREDVLALVQKDPELYRELKKHLDSAERELQKYDSAARKSMSAFMSPTDENLPKIDHLQAMARHYEENAEEHRFFARKLLSSYLNRNEQGMSEDQLDELSPATINSYRSKAIGQAAWAGGVAKYLRQPRSSARPEDPKYKNSNWTDPDADYGPEGNKYAKLNQKRGAGILAATKRGATAPGQSYDWIRQGGYGDKTNPAIKGVAEAKGKKPDFLDLDKDGDKNEPMKKAAADKKKTVKEEDNERKTTHGTEVTKGNITTHTRNYEPDVEDDDDFNAEPRKAGRPKGTKHATGAKGPTGKSKLQNLKAIREEGDTCPHCGSKMVMGSHDKKPAKKVKEADAAPAAKNKGDTGYNFGTSGIYDSLNRQVDNLITEGMSVTVNMTTDDTGQPHKDITVHADGDDAAKLAELLNLAGIHRSEQSCSSCGQSPCGCGGQMVDENSPSNEPDPVFASVDQVAGPNTGGGPNAPHVMINPADPTFNPPGDMAQDTVNAGPGARRLPATTNEGIQADLGMSLYKELQQFKGK